jgi:GR25 family glycosyltransferase involved in LPS biosynthesis
MDLFVVIVVVVVILYLIWFKVGGSRAASVVDGVVLINLKHNENRLRTFTRKYNKSDMRGIDFVNLGAIYGKNVDYTKVCTPKAVEELNELFETGYRSQHYQLSIGAIGCYLSHLKAWYHCIQKGWDNCLIFEDDANIPSNFKREMKHALRNAPDDYDVILLGHLCNKCSKMKTNIHHYKVDRFYLTHTYIISSKCIRKLLSHPSIYPISQQIDSQMSDLSSELNIYAVAKKIIYQDSSFETNIQVPIRILT